jgi:hypothetical protein
MYNVTPNQLNVLYKQEDGGNEMKYQMYPRNKFIRADEPPPNPKEVSSTILR